MAIETNIGHVIQAINFASRKDLYFVLGRDQDWADPSTPDTEDPDITMLTNPLALVKADRLVLCYESTDPVTTSAADGDDYIVYKGKKWTTVPIDEAINNNGQLVKDANYVCLVGGLDVSALPMMDFTQIGVVENPSIAENAPSKHAVDKSNVLNWGQLLFYENRIKESYTDSQRKILKYLIRF